MTTFETIKKELQTQTETLVNSYDIDINNISHKVHDLLITSKTLYSLNLLTSKEYNYIKQVVNDRNYGIVSLIHDKRTLIRKL